MRFRRAMLFVCGLVIATWIGHATASRQPEAVRLVELKRGLPTIGNIDAVKDWKFGRIQQVIQTGGGDADITIEIRMEDSSVVRVIGPRSLSNLARASEWFWTPANDRPSRADYTERMIAFDADENNRIIAMMSLEPTRRDNNRMRRALGR